MTSDKKATVAKKPRARDLPSKRSIKGGSLTATTQELSNISKSQHDSMQRIIANMRA